MVHKIVIEKEKIAKAERARIRRKIETLDTVPMYNGEQGYSVDAVKEILE